jgi:hypothetical protein
MNATYTVDLTDLVGPPPGRQQPIAERTSRQCSVRRAGRGIVKVRAVDLIAAVLMPVRSGLIDAQLECLKTGEWSAVDEDGGVQQ